MVQGCVQKTVECREIKTPAGYEFLYDSLQGKKKSVYHRGQETSLAHIGYNSGKPNFDQQHVVSIDQRAVVTHNCSDLRIESVDDEQTPVKDFCLTYITTDSKPTPLPPASNGEKIHPSIHPSMASGTVIPQGIGGHVDSGGDVGSTVDSGVGGDSGSHVGRDLAIGLSVGGILLLLLLLLVIGFVIWRKKPKWFRRLRRADHLCWPKVQWRVVPKWAVPNGVIQDGGVPNAVIQDGGVPNGVIQDGGVPNGAVPNGVIQDGGVPNGAVPNGVVLGGAAHDAVVPGGEAAAPDRFLGGLLPNGVIQDEAVPNGVGQDGVVPGAAVLGAVVPGGEAAAPKCDPELEDEEEAVRVPLIPDEVVVTVDGPDMEPDQADRAPKGMNCRLLVPDVEAAQQHEPENDV